MHDTNLINQFVELRAQGLSIPKISEKISVPPTTLYYWNERARARIHKLRLLLVEQVEERILGAQHEQYEPLAQHLKAVDKQIAAEIEDGSVEQLTLTELVRLAASLRRQLHRLKIHIAAPSREPDAPVDSAPGAPLTSPEQTDPSEPRNGNFS